MEILLIVVFLVVATWAVNRTSKKTTKKHFTPTRKTKKKVSTPKASPTQEKPPIKIDDYVRYWTGNRVDSGHVMDLSGNTVTIVNTKGDIITIRIDMVIR